MQTIRATSDTAIGGTSGGAEVYARECKIISIIQWREDGQQSEGGPHRFPIGPGGEWGWVGVLEDGAGGVPEVPHIPRITYVRCIFART